MRILVRILNYIRPYWTYAALGYLALTISMGMQLSIPRLVEYVIDSGLFGNSTRVLTLGALAIVGVGLAQGAFTYMRSYIFQFMAERAAYDIRNALYRHLQRLPFSFFDRSHTGQLMSRGTEDINAIRRFMTFSLRSIVQSTAMLILITIILISIHVQLAILALALTPVLAFTAIRFGRSIRPLYLAVQQQFGVMTTRLQENLAGTRVVRSFAQEDREIDQFDHELDELYERNMDAVRRSALYFPFMTLLATISIAVVLWFGGRLVVSGELSIGQLTAFYLYMAMLQMPVRLLGWVVNSAARAIAAGERVFGILDHKPEIVSDSGAVDLVDIHGHVEFRNVWLRYPGEEEYALKGVSFIVEPSQRIALIGETGSGKSSVTSLIPRFYDVSAGTVLVDGHDVRDVDLASLRRQVGIVLQDTFLFSVTIHENIAYGRPEASRREVISAAKSARAHKFIMNMPDGYDTVVGERGISLSGGQKQRIAIARALAMDPAILILDDATSNVDSETEYVIQQALDELMATRTTFVIAHRLLTLKTADLILVMKQGEIVERGTHDQLLSSSTLYRQIYDLQLREQESVASATN